MKLLHKTSAIPFYLVHSGFQSFKCRLREILCATSGLTLEDYVDDETLGVYYRNGDSPEYIAAAIIGPDMEIDSTQEQDHYDSIADAS